MSDPFHLNADYMKGVLYEGRRQFLNTVGEDSLKPPLEFMTKKQARSTLKIERDNATKTVDFNHILVIKTNKKDEPDEETTKHQKHVAEKEKKRTTKNKRQAMIVIEEFTSTRPEDWSEQNQAGVNTWVNHNTGEVSGKCPWKSYINEKGGEDEDENVEFAGTGSIVYDNSEFEEFLNMLDTTAAKEKKK